MIILVNILATTLTMFAVWILVSYSILSTLKKRADKIWTELNLELKKQSDLNLINIDKEDLALMGNKINLLKESYNEAATKYNMIFSKIPFNIIVFILEYRKAEYFQKEAG